MILLIDDDRNNLLIVGKFLEHFGFKYDTAENGKQGIELFQKKKYQLVLMDIQMPEMNGVECTQAIRKLECEKCDVPIVALTAQIFREELNKYLAAGIDDYLIKPFDPSELKLKIEKFKIDKDYQETSSNDQKKNNNNYEIINLNYLQRLAKGEEHFVKEMLVTIAEDVPFYLEKLEQAFEDKNAPQIKKVIHKLNSPFGTIGLNSLHVINYFNQANDEELISAKGFEALTELKNISTKAILEIKKELISKKQ